MACLTLLCILAAEKAERSKHYSMQRACKLRVASSLRESVSLEYPWHSAALFWLTGVYLWPEDVRARALALSLAKQTRSFR